MESRPDFEITYTVPKRFGMRTLLVVTALCGGLLAIAKTTAVPTGVMVFYSLFLAAVCVSQMLFERMPRLASILTGAIYMPAVIFGAEFLPVGTEDLLRQVLPRFDTDQSLMWIVVIGGFLGYLTGTVMAGVFMVFERAVPPQARMPAKDHGAAA
jgi:hypothetical protein